MNFDNFMRIYAEQLEIAVRNHPDEYSWPIENVPTVADKMRGSFVNKTYSKDGHAIKATCKILNIKHTYKAINEYLGVA